MKKFICFLLVFTFGVEVFSAFSQTSKTNTKRAAKTSSSSRKVSSSSSKSSSSGRRSVIATTTTKTETSAGNDFDSCMDNFCKSSSAEDKGRCRCSSQLSRIEKTLRDIEKIQNEADEENKLMETLMNVSNVASVTDVVGSVYDNINSIEKKAKTISAIGVDKATLVMEGLPLYEEAFGKCESSLSSYSNDDKEAKITEYNKLIEADCSAYTTVLKEKADSAKNLLVQAKKNREMYDEQEYKKLNQLDTNACYVEYEACTKTECGINFSHCKDDANVQRVLKKCQAVNYGKCEDNKVVVMRDIKKYIAKELEKVRLAETCKAAAGHLKNGQCLFKVLYVADKCSSSKKGCGSSQEVWARPSQSFVCADREGSFQDLVVGCWESCYIEGPNGERFYKGTNSETGKKKSGKLGLAILTSGLSLIGTGVPQCKSSFDKFSTPPPPSGWGADGYPINPELRGTF
ncbi:hypothetical protein HDR59_04680 [bacterium]|nr:hypothetical protein [bacterium]